MSSGTSDRVADNFAARVATILARPSRRLPHAPSFWVVAATFLAIMSFTTVPTPLYPLYQQLDRFPPFMITVIFACYGVGVIAGLFLLGHVSDQVGRRTMALGAVALELVSAVMFTLSAGVPVLLIARFVCGLRDRDPDGCGDGPT